jgi:FdhD protein
MSTAASRAILTAPLSVEEGKPIVAGLGDVVSWSDNSVHLHADTLAVEEPLEIRFAGFSVSVTMRTPGHDFDLATGFLYTEGIIDSITDIASITYCPTEDVDSQFNIINVNPRDPTIVDPQRWQRHFFMSSSCGICGKASITAVRQEAPPIASQASISVRVLYQLDIRLREAQTVFSQTGGLHAAGLFDLDGHLLTVREDVGRHNAVDKVIGWALQSRPFPLDNCVLMVSGRASFEIVQKALMAGVPIVTAISAPSNLAVELARAANMTLIGFLRPGRFNVYAGSQRVIGDA